MNAETQQLITVGIVGGLAGFIACYLVIWWWSGQARREMEEHEDRINRQRFDENR